MCLRTINKIKIVFVFYVRIQLYFLTKFLYFLPVFHFFPQLVSHISYKSIYLSRSIASSKSFSSLNTYNKLLLHLNPSLVVHEFPHDSTVKNSHICIQNFSCVWPCIHFFMLKLQIYDNAKVIKIWCKWDA